MPRDLGVRQELEYHGEEHRDQRQRQNGVHDLGQCLHSRDHAAEPLSHKRDGCREKKGNQEQEANHQDKTKSVARLCGPPHSVSTVKRGPHLFRRRQPLLGMVFKNLDLRRRAKDDVPQLFEILPKSVQCVLVILDYKYAQRIEITGADTHTGNRFPRPWQP